MKDNFYVNKTQLVFSAHELTENNVPVPAHAPARPITNGAQLSIMFQPQTKVMIE